MSEGIKHQKYRDAMMIQKSKEVFHFFFNEKFENFEQIVT